MCNNGHFLLQEMKNSRKRALQYKLLALLHLERFDRSLMVQLADMDLFVCRAGGKAFFRFPGRWNWTRDNEKIKELPVHIKSWSRVKRKLLLAAPRCCVPDNRRPDNEKEVMDSLSQIIVFLMEMVKAGSTSQTNLSTPALRMKFPVLFHFKAKMGPCKRRI